MIQNGCVNLRAGETNVGNTLAPAPSHRAREGELPADVLFYQVHWRVHWRAHWFGCNVLPGKKQSYDD